MLSHLSWTNYLQAAVLSLLLYYVYVALCYYATELRRLFRSSIGAAQNGRELPEPLVYHGPENRGPVSALPVTANEFLPEDTFIEAEILITNLKHYIAEAANKPYSPGVLIAQIKRVFQENISFKNSPHRLAINELIVSECEKTGTAQLTEEEVDQWWTTQ